MKNKFKEKRYLSRDPLIKKKKNCKLNYNVKSNLLTVIVNDTLLEYNRGTICSGKSLI